MISLKNVEEVRSENYKLLLACLRTRSAAMLTPYVLNARPLGMIVYYHTTKGVSH